MFLVFVLLLSPDQGYSQAVDTTDIVDLNLFSGSWYEIASTGIDNKRACHCTTREFEYIPGRKFIKIITRCIMFRKGRSDIALNTQRVYPGSNNRIFTTLNLGVHGTEIEIILLHKDYNWAVTWFARKGSLQLLCRDAFIPAHRYNEIVKLIHGKGYNTGNIEKTAQNCDNIP